VTNDLGEYRVYGLPPGEYIVSARSRQFGARVTMGAGGRRDRAEGLIPTFFPGTTNVAEAQIVRTAAGQEIVANFAAVSGRLLRVSGRVQSATGRSLDGVSVFLEVETSNSGQQINGGSVSADGSFNISNVPPGDFTLRVREQGTGSPSNEVAMLPITLSTTDLTDLQLTTRPGTTIRGRVEWDGASARPTSTRRVGTRLAEPRNGLLDESTFTYLDLERGTVRDDDSFELGGTVGRVLFQFGAPSWTMKAVTVDGRDITNTGVDAATLGGDKRIVIVMTDRLTDLTGTVQDSRRRAVADYVVVVLPQEPVPGAAASRFTRMLRPDTSGAFRAQNLPAGDYVAAAMPPLESGREWDPEIQKVVRGNGKRFTLADGETKTLSLEELR
jgi:hypothetical protein